jgi:hypothetical protein
MVGYVTAWLINRESVKCDGKGAAAKQRWMATNSQFTFRGFLKGGEDVE